MENRRLLVQARIPESDWDAVICEAVVRYCINAPVVYRQEQSCRKNRYAT